MIKLSILIPVYNEKDSLEALHDQIKHALTDFPEGYEILMIDDGSTDGSTQKMAEIARHDPVVRIFRFPRNQGKSAVYTSGFKETRGEVIITMDADLQDDPAEIHNLLSHLQKGFDLVVGWKRNRFQNEAVKAFPSKIFNAIVCRLFGVRLRDTNSGFRAMTADLAKSINLYGDNYRFLPQLAHLQGFRVSEVPVNHRQRKYGKSKYGARRFLTGLLDILALRFTVSFMEKPLHIFGGIAMLFLILGGGLEVYVLIQKLLGNPFQQHIAALAIGILFLTVGVQVLSIGLIGVMLVAQNSTKSSCSLQAIGGNP